MDVIREIEKLETENDKPKIDIVIVDCGEITEQDLVIAIKLSLII